MARRGENIYKRKDGRWEGRFKNGFKPNGKTRYSSVYGKSYAEVRTILAQKRSTRKPDFSRCTFTFAELATLWLESIKNTVKESTYSNYMMKLKKHIFPIIGKIKYENLTIKILNDFIAQKLSCGLSSKYVFDIASIIKSITKFAHRKLNFADKAELLSMPKKEFKTAKALLSPEQQDSLVNALKISDTPYQIGILLAAVTGLRIGELCALKWSEIDLKKRIITVEKTMQRIKNNDGISATKIIITTPKSRDSARKIPISEFMIPILNRIKSENEDYLLTGKNLFAEPRTMQYRFKSLLKKLGLPQVNFHALRHMFATRCIVVGFDIKTLSEILGHSSVDITLNRYVHPSFERKKQCFKLLSDSFMPSILPSV